MPNLLIFIFNKRRKGRNLVNTAENLPQVIRNLILHHEDYLNSVDASNINLRSAASEKWTEVLRKAYQEALGTDESACDAVRNGLIVNFVQWPTKTLLKMISPYFMENEKKIQTQKIKIRDKQILQFSKSTLPNSPSSHSKS